MKKEGYFQIMSNSDVKLKCQSLYSFENKNKSKSKAPVVVNMCSKGEGGVTDAETSSSSSSQQSAVTGPPPPRLKNSSVGFTKENSSCVADNRRQESKVCILPYFYTAWLIFFFLLWKMCVLVLLFVYRELSVYVFQVNIFITTIGIKIKLYLLLAVVCVNLKSRKCQHLILLVLFPFLPDYVVE
jgi:hypothetical protein